MVNPSVTYSSSAGKPPTMVDVVASVQNATTPAVLSFPYSAASANESVLIEYLVSMFGTSGAINTSSAVQRICVGADTIANDTLNAFVGAIGDTRLVGVPGFSLSILSPGNTSVLQVTITTAGTASVTVSARISRASA